jgi:O-antigen/teichoic acid export membrane protein
LPALADVSRNRIAFQNRLDFFHLYIYGIAAVFCVGFVLLANPVLGMLFGPSFEAEAILLFLVALAQGIRLCRAPQSVAAQALGQTDIPFKANLVRVSAVLFAVAAVALGGSITTLLVIACVGEGAAWAAQNLFFSLRTRRTARRPGAKPLETLS